ncbi:MAG: NUDIX hydrolase [Nitrososphaera sp.]|uniref:NUDIX hydrolase n=1 Tax=Nitrososphaera sp. TaxID=1971748 RepID=UPI00183A86E0|nr:NUDIX hydrolase [Nitrososphaera sp.]NWG37890.1 NUDIX hydrolase [Nitrososphaera sp.]
MSHRNPVPTVDVILQKGSKVLMIRRKKEPFAGRLALPGGFVNEGETVEDAARREALEETSLEIEPIEILGVYSDPARDPRRHVLTVAFVSIITGGVEQASDDAAGLQWVELADVEKMKDRIAFDHAKILADYRKWKTENGTFWSTKGQNG